jgi:hypothetical protein
VLLFVELHRNPKKNKLDPPSTSDIVATSSTLTASTSSTLTAITTDAYDFPVDHVFVVINPRND